MRQREISSDGQNPCRWTGELCIELPCIAPQPQEGLLRNIFRRRAVEPHAAEIAEYPALMRLDDATEGDVIPGGYSVDVGVHGAAPDALLILAGGEKVTAGTGQRGRARKLYGTRALAHRSK